MLMIPHNNFIAFEGLDGSGKSIQLKLLADYLHEKDIKCKVVHFPQIYNSPYGELVARFLRGEFGHARNVDPLLVSLLFALDRKESATRITQWLYQGYFVLADRYVYSNIAFQCAKLDSNYKKDELRNWILYLEYEYNRIPKPGLSIFLDVPIQFVIHTLSSSRYGEERRYLNGKDDIHEADIGLQKSVRHEYLKLVELYDDFVRIDCFSQEEERMLSPHEINEKIIDTLKEFLL